MTRTSLSRSKGQRSRSQGRGHIIAASRLQLVFAVFVVGYIRIVDLTRGCKLFLVFVLGICCFVIVNMPLIYICCFASVMRKQVNYHPHNSLYDPYGGKVRPLFVYKFQADRSIRPKVTTGSQNFEIGSRDRDHAHLGVILSFIRLPSVYQI